MALDPARIVHFSNGSLLTKVNLFAAIELLHDGIVSREVLVGVYLTLMLVLAMFVRWEYRHSRRNRRKSPLDI